MIPNNEEQEKERIEQDWHSGPTAKKIASYGGGKGGEITYEKKYPRMFVFVRDLFRSKRCGNAQTVGKEQMFEHVDPTAMLFLI